MLLREGYGAAVQVVAGKKSMVEPPTQVDEKSLAKALRPAKTIHDFFKRAPEGATAGSSAPAPAPAAKRTHTSTGPAAASKRSRGMARFVGAPRTEKSQSEGDATIDLTASPPPARPAPKRTGKAPAIAAKHCPVCTQLLLGDNAAVNTHIDACLKALASP